MPVLPDQHNPTVAHIGHNADRGPMLETAPADDPAVRQLDLILKQVEDRAPVDQFRFWAAGFDIIHHPTLTS
jgi:hypothetical protein